MALLRAKLGVSLFRHPCRKPLSQERGYFTGATPLDQARMLAVSHTKPLHDAVAQMADDLYGGYAPATPFYQKVQLKCIKSINKIRRQLREPVP